VPYNLNGCGLCGNVNTTSLQIQSLQEQPVNSAILIPMVGASARFRYSDDACILMVGWSLVWLQHGTVLPPGRNTLYVRVAHIRPVGLLRVMVVRMLCL
jgi:hypothetical protein